MMYRVEAKEGRHWVKVADFGTEDEACDCMEDQYYFDTKEGLGYREYRVRKIRGGPVRSGNERKTYPVMLDGETYMVSLYVGEYTNGRLAIILIDEEGEDFEDLTVNLPWERCPEGCAYVDTNACSDTERFVRENGLGEFTGYYARSGFCSYPLYRFDTDKLTGKTVSKSKKKKLRSRSEKKKKKTGPADYVFRRDQSPHGCFDFGDGWVGYIGDPDFDVEEFIDDPDWSKLDSKDIKEYEDYLRSQFGGKLPIGNMYIDMWGPNGQSYEGGCYLYFEGETIRDWCDRNGEPYPTKEIPEEIIDEIQEREYRELEERLKKKGS